MKILLTIVLCYFSIQIPITSLKLEGCFFMFAVLFFLYNVFFEREKMKEVHEYAEIFIGIGVTTYICLFAYITDFSVLETLALVIFVLSYPVSHFYSKNDYPKIKIGNES
ncbi:MAG: Unknown protein [uncultured Aureispira sp.]|uniref:Uncharacterized protein n=1 Tax=uncultured Aureispira sp. TaxID=1331704 RepID=A0A6S6TRW2_9BACT|nr:MAG: Unknown protein [uncultured Aureispira sp.]